MRSSVDRDVKHPGSGERTAHGDDLAAEVHGHLGRRREKDNESSRRQARRSRPMFVLRADDGAL